MPIMQLLVLFFAGSAMAANYPVSVESTRLVASFEDLTLASCPASFLPPTLRNETANGHHTFHHDDILETPIYLERSRSEDVPLSTQPLQRPSTPAEHCNSRTIPSHQVLTSAPPIHRRLDLVKGLLLDNWRQKRAVATTGLIHLFLSSSKRIDVPGEVEVDGEAASGLRPRNSKVHVGAAAVALLSLATVMCML